ncbi:unnamed protein product, partial [Rotaria sp. Silwood2]
CNSLKKEILSYSCNTLDEIDYVTDDYLIIFDKIVITKQMKKQTHPQILLSSANTFGDEMDFNYHSLVVENEALFRKIPSYNEGLTRMDLLLERCSTS